MPTKIITVSAVPPAESSGADTNKGAAMNATEYDQNIINLRAAVDRALAALGGFTASQTPGANQIPAVKADLTTAFPGAVAVAGAITAIGGRSQILCDTTVIPALGTAGGIASIGRNDGLVALDIGYESTSGNMWMQAQRHDAATAYNILLQPRGGNVLAGTTTDNYSGAKLQVAGGATFSGPVSASPPTTAAVLVDFSVTTGRIMVSDGVGGWAKDLSICPYGGTTLVGTTVNNGSGVPLQVAGGATFTSNIKYYCGTLPALNASYEMAIYAVGNTLVKIAMRGDDGVTRFASITLA